jgi:hypothetical protein
MVELSSHALSMLISGREIPGLLNQQEISTSMIQRLSMLIMKWRLGTGDVITTRFTIRYTREPTCDSMDQASLERSGMIEIACIAYTIMSSTPSTT